MDPAPKPQEEEWEDPYPKKKTTYWFTGIAFMIALYVLSIGPAARLVQENKISEAAAANFYRPLVVVAELTPQTTELLAWYARSWEKKSPY